MYRLSTNFFLMSTFFDKLSGAKPQGNEINLAASRTAMRLSHREEPVKIEAEEEKEEKEEPMPMAAITHGPEHSARGGEGDQGSC